MLCICIFWRGINVHLLTRVGCSSFFCFFFLSPCSKEKERSRHHGRLYDSVSCTKSPKPYYFFLERPRSLKRSTVAVPFWVTLSPAEQSVQGTQSPGVQWFSAGHSMEVHMLSPCTTAASSVPSAEEVIPDP